MMMCGPYMEGTAMPNDLEKKTKNEQQKSKAANLPHPDESLGLGLGVVSEVLDGVLDIIPDILGAMFSGDS